MSWVNYSLHPSPQISDTSSSKLMHLRDYATYFSEKNKQSNEIVAHHHIYLSAPGWTHVVSLLPCYCRWSPHSHSPPTLPLRQISPSCTHQDSLLQISPLALTIVPLYKSIPLGIQICYYFPKLKNQSRLNRINHSSPSSFQFIPCSL